MCRCCSGRRASCCLFAGGGALLLLGAVVGAFWLPIYDAILRWQLVLTPTSTSYGIWEDIPIPIYMEFTLFNVTNAAKVQKDPSVLPEVVEMGPYVFREYHHRVNLSWNANNTLTYRQYRTYHFQPHLSGGSLDDEVTNFNIIAATTAYGTRFLPRLFRQLVSRLLEKTGAALLVTRTAGELLFDGYYDPMLSIAKQLNSPLFAIPFQEFAYFAERNNSFEYDGWFNMYTGKDDLMKLGLHSSWNFQKYTEFYGHPCSEVRGSTGDLWPPVEDYRDAEIFVPDLCLTVKLPFSRKTEFLGVPGLHYEASNRTLDNGELHPETRCHCLGECVPRGALNISLCRWDAPLVLSQPHFFQADPSYLAHSKGLRPDPDKHKIELAINPESGIPLYVNARFQLSLMVENYPDMSLFQKLRERAFVPMVWFNQRVELSEELAPLLRLLVAAPQLGAGLLFGAAGAGALLLLCALVRRVRRAWPQPDEARPLLPDGSDDVPRA